MQAPAVDQALLDMAIDLARGAGALTRKWFDRGVVAFDTKEDGSPVTEADMAAERYLREQIALAFPTDAVIGEEEEDREGTSGRTWIIDPIDGTRSFKQGVPLYGTLLAVTDEHGPAVGVIVMPALDEVVAAGRGLGCTHNGRPTSVSEQTSLDDSYVMTSGFEYWQETYDRTRFLEGNFTMRTWGDAYGYVLLATGRTEAVVDPNINLWDIAPMQVIIPEAGGKISDQTGGEWQPGRHFVASNGHVHEQLLATIFTATPEAQAASDGDELADDTTDDEPSDGADAPTPAE